VRWSIRRREKRRCWLRSNREVRDDAITRKGLRNENDSGQVEMSSRGGTVDELWYLIWWPVQTGPIGPTFRDISGARYGDIRL